MTRNQSNDGRAFQEKIQTVANQYKFKNLLALAKVDPPMRVMGSGPARRFIYLPNPFVDFVGAWTEAGGRMLCVEAKSTTEDRLPLLTSGGLSQSQYDAMREWAARGAISFLLWEWKDQGVALIELNVLIEAVEAIRRKEQFKRIEWREQWKLERGIGFVHFDFRKRMIERFT